MGVCVNKDQPQANASPKALNTETRNPSQRQRLSVLTVTSEEEKGHVEVFNRQVQGHFLRSGTSHSIRTTEGKEEQGTVLLFGHRVVIEGQMASSQQSGFEDKHLSISGDIISADVLAKAGIAFTCKKGLKPESPNQDDFSIVLNNESIILGVFDGHGPFGHCVSDYVHTLLPKLIMTHGSFESSPIESIKSAFETAHNNLRAHCDHPDTDFDCVISGTTASVALFRKHKVIVAHVGDSRVVMGKRRNGAIVAVPVTSDHKPMVPAEKARIELKGGEVKKLPYDIPYRVFLHDSDYPGLSMSRAIGDTVAHDLGVISDPDIVELDITEEDEFLLLCSDGVWEFIKNEEAVELVARFSRLQAKQAAEKLAQLAWTRWLHNENEVVDDITVIVAFIPKS